MDETDERLHISFNNQYQELLQAGKSDQEAKSSIKKNTEFTAFTQWLDEKAEIDLVELFKKEMEGLKIPCFIARSVKQEDFANEREKPYMKNLSAFRNLGLKNLPDTATEADILVAYVWGDSIRIAITEVKNINQYPWGSALVPDSQNNNKAIAQLAKDLKLVDSLLEDLPADKLSFQLFSAFPSCKEEDLETIFCSDCLQSVINQKDTSSPANLRKKLGVDGPIPTATDAGKELLLTLVSRLAGPASRLHLLYRLTTDKARREQARHQTNVEEVDKKIEKCEYVVLSPKQKAVLNQVQQSPHFTIRGRAGSGKTLLCVAMARAMADADKQSTLIMTSGWAGMGKSSPTMTHMANQVKADGGNVIIDDMGAVCKIFGLDMDSFENNHPALLSALAHSAGQKYGRVVIAVDELLPSNAPEIQVGGNTHYDWRALGQVSGQARLVLAFNPQSPCPVILPDDQCFSHVESELRYRSSRNITNLTDLMGVHTGRDACVETQDSPASDVAGSLPYVKDLGKFSPAMVEAAVTNIKQQMDNEHNITAVTMLYDGGLTGNMQDKIKELGKKFNWPVYDVDEYAGWEEETIIYIGPGEMEALSRAKLHLFVVQGYEEEKHKRRYEQFRAGFVQAEKQGLVKFWN